MNNGYKFKNIIIKLCNLKNFSINIYNDEYKLKFNYII